jgi:hypothetical protein
MESPVLWEVISNAQIGALRQSRRNFTVSSSRSQSSQVRNQSSAYRLFLADFLLRLPFDHEDGVTAFP